MRRKILWLFIALLMGDALQAQIKGVVYEDKNGNGRRDFGERGMEGVVVSDGYEVVKTDQEGKFLLPSQPEARFVFITCPSGFRNSRNYYLPVNPEISDYDFGIYANVNEGKEGFSFVHLTDTELFKCVRENWLDDLKNYIKKNPTAFIIHTGDICYIPGMQYHARHIGAFSLGVPYYQCIGNHDLVKGKYGEEVYEKLFGPVYYSFDAGKVHFVVLPMWGGDHAPSYSSKVVTEWLRKDLALHEDKQVVIFEHDIWAGGNHFVFKDREGKELDLTQHHLKAWIYGHWHNHFAAQLKNGVWSYCASTPDKGGIDHGPACFRVFHVDGQGNLFSETRYAGCDRLLNLVVPCEGDTLTATAGKIPVVVNTYHTASRAEMVRVGIEKDGKVKKWYSLSPATDWAWEGDFALVPGAYTMKVEVNFADGNRLTDQNRFVVSGDKVQGDTGQEWGNLRGNAAHNVTLSGDIHFPLRLNWVNNAGGNIWMTSPVVADGRVFVATIDDDRNQNCHVDAYDALQGQRLWRFKTRNSVKNTIVCQDGIVAACDAEGYLYGLEAKSGKCLWEIKLNKNLLPPCSVGLAVEQGIVYAGQGHALSAVCLKEGKLLWQNKDWNGGEGTTSTLTVGDGVLVASAHWNALFGHDLQDGKKKWNLSEDGLRFRDGSPTFYKNSFYVASSEHLFEIEPESGKILRKAKSRRSLNAACAPLVTERYVIVGTSGDGVSAYNRETFEEIWNYRTAPALFYTVPYTTNEVRTVEVSPLLIGDTLLFGASDGYLHAIDVNTGVFRWKRKLGAPVLSSMAVSGQMLYVSDFAGNIYGFTFQ